MKTEKTPDVFRGKGRGYFKHLNFNSHSAKMMEIITFLKD
jgi:hypothetical protein